MNLLLVSPKYPTTYWGFQHSLPYVNKRASLPPLGLLTVAALLPEHCRLRLIDLNVEPLADRDIDWAEAVLVGGMLIQARSMRQVVARCKARKRRVVVGGPAPTSQPEAWPNADIVFCGEAEGRIDQLMAALAAPDRHQVVLRPNGPRPAMAQVPVPRYELLQQHHYASVSVQYSRGCPYNCEFCDVVQLFGRRPRVKDADQVIAELSALYDLGYRGSVFFVDDNFIGNKPAVKALLPRMIAWQRARDYPFDLYTEASVNLAADTELTRHMVDAGFTAVFLGIETPSAEALAGANKKHNLKLDLHDAIEQLTRAGLQVMGGFILGFDQDGTSAADAQRDFISAAPTPLAMVGMLTALPNTPLWRRLEREGRLRRDASGDQFGRPNFDPALDEAQLLADYARLMASLYSADSYYARCRAHVALAPRPPGAAPKSRDLGAFVRAVVGIGIASRRRTQFWKLLAYTARHHRHNFAAAVAHAIKGEHLIRYTEQVVLPRIDRALRAVRAERRFQTATAGALPASGGRPVWRAANSAPFPYGETTPPSAAATRTPR